MGVAWIAAQIIPRVATSILLVQAPSNSVAFHFKDSQVMEASAMVALPDGDLVTTNDSGDVGRIFTVDEHGTTLGTTYWDPGATDVEALALADADDVWVGDTGDNASKRDHIEVAKVPVSRDGKQTVTPVVYRLRYPDGAHDAETLMSAPDGRLLIATKGFFGGTLYATPKGFPSSSADRRVTTLEQLSSPGAILAMATDGAFFPDGKHFLVRGYTSATLYAWPSLAPLGSMSLPSQKQGEGLGIAPDDTLWLSSEGVKSDVLHITLSSKLQALLTPSSPASGTSSPASGTSSADSDRSWWPWIAGGAVISALVVSLARRR